MKQLRDWPANTPMGNMSKYDRILDGGVWVLEKGKDFTDTPKAERMRVFSAARSRGKGVRTHQPDDTRLIVQAIEKGKGR